MVLSGRSWPLVSVLAAAFVLVGASACGSTADSPRADDAPTDTPSEDPSSFAEVLALSLFSGGSVVDHVIDDSVARCMSDRGFDVDGAAASDDEVSRTEEQTATEVDTYGYGISTNPPQTVEMRPDPVEQAVAGLTSEELDAFHLALLGSADPSVQPSPESCLGRAFADVEELQLLLTGEASTLAADYAARVDADPRIVAAQDAWRTCLADQGYGGYGDRFEIVEDVSRRAEAAGDDLSEVQAFELQIARIDFDCSAAEFETRREAEAELAAAFAQDVAALNLAAAETD